MCDDGNSNIIKCKAAVLWRIGEPELEVKEIEVDPPKSNEVRIKMLCASLCHTDIHCCGGFPLPLFPRVPGHEGVGMVESVGEGVKRTEEVKVGDIVMPTYIGECGKCENCESNEKKTNLCRAFPLPLSGLMPDGTSRMSIGGQRIYHHFTCSTMSEYTVVDINYVVKVDPRIPLPHASLLSCGYSTGFGAAWKEAQALLRKESTIAVLGLGAVGLGVVEGARIQGVSRIIGVDINEQKRERAKVFGITDFINPSLDPDKPISDLVKQLTNGLGVDYSFECTGFPALVNEAIESTKEGTGTAVIIGAGTESRVEITRMPLLLGRTVKGCIFGGIKVKSELPFLLGKSIDKELNLDKLVTHQVSLDEINEAFRLLMEHPDCLKVLIKF